MIQDFKTYIGEGTLWGNTIMRSDTVRVRKEDDIITEEYVRSFIDEDFIDDCKKITIRKENGTTVVDIEGDFYFKDDITEIPFQFGKVTECFDINGCEKITSLKGCPKEVGYSFSCSECHNLTSLEGCPEYVGGYFSCENCGKKFKIKEVKELCKVKGYIYI